MSQNSQRQKDCQNRPPDSRAGSGGDLTLLLHEVAAGRRPAADAVALVYDEIRAMAAAHMSRERPGHTLDPTSLANEVVLRFGGESLQFQNRAHFFGSVALAMRRILVESARRKKAAMRGGGALRETTDLDGIQCKSTPDEILTVDETLTELAHMDPRKATVVQLWYFLGLPYQTIADLLDVDVRTIDREIEFIRRFVSGRLDPHA